MLSYLKDSVKSAFQTESVVTKAITDHPWGPTAPEMDAVVEAFPTEQEVLLPQILERLNSTGAYWSRCYKTLLLLEHLLRFLPFQYIDDLYQFRPLVQDIGNNFVYVDTRKNVDHGASVQERAKKVLVLLTDREVLTEERKKSASAQGKYVSVSSDGGTTLQSSGTKTSGDSRIGADFTRPKARETTTPPPKPGISSETMDLPKPQPFPTDKIIQAKVVEAPKPATPTPVNDPFAFLDASSAPAPAQAASPLSNGPTVGSNGTAANTEDFDDFFSSRNATATTSNVASPIPAGTPTTHDDTSFFGQPAGTPQMVSPPPAPAKKDDGLDFLLGK